MYQYQMRRIWAFYFSLIVSIETPYGFSLLGQHDDLLWICHFRTHSMKFKSKYESFLTRQLLKMSSAKRWIFCVGLSVAKLIVHFCFDMGKHTCCYIHILAPLLLSPSIPSVMWWMLYVLDFNTLWSVLLYDHSIVTNGLYKHKCLCNTVRENTTQSSQWMEINSIINPILFTMQMCKIQFIQFAYFHRITTFSCCRANTFVFHSAQ